MNKIFSFTSTFKALNEDEDGIHICGMASTNDADRANDIIDTEAWTKGGLANFEKNPIILFNHDYNKPIGRATGLKVTDNGLELKAKISKSAPDSVGTLIKEGILGAFSVGFRVKDAEYLEETDGLKIKDAELFEVSVVSVPCNQAATFSLAKSFDSEAEYEDFKKTFLKNSVDLAGQSLAKDEVNTSSVASDTPEPAQSAQKEIEMSDVKNSEIDLEAFAKKVAEETAAKIAMKQAESKAAEEKAVLEQQEKQAEEAEAKASKEAEVKAAIITGVQSGTEKLMADFEEKMSESNANQAEVIAKFQKELTEKEQEITKMRESRGVFADRGSEKSLEKYSKELMHAHLAGIITGKGWNTDYAKSVFEKAGVTYTATGGQNDPGIDVVVSQTIEKEIQLELRTAALFKEMAVESQSTVLPLQSDTNLAKWANARDGADNGSGSDISNRKDTPDSNTYSVGQKVIQVDRLISTSFLDNYIDEKVLINIMPMLTSGIARSHARAVDSAIINGNSANITGLIAHATPGASWGANVAANTTFSAEVLVKCRRGMGVYGLNPQEVVFIVSQDKYYDLLEDPDFQTVDEVGSDVAVRLTGQVGRVYGSPVVLTDNMPDDAEDAFGGALCVNTSNFIIPRLRGVTVEQDYEVSAQRRVLVATQHMGFDELFAGAAGKSAATHAVYDALA